MCAPDHPIHLAPDRRALIALGRLERGQQSRFAQAGEILAANPQGMRLRYLTILQSISSERTNTVIFPVPIELTELWQTREKKE